MALQIKCSLAKTHTLSTHTHTKHTKHHTKHSQSLNCRRTVGHTKEHVDLFCSNCIPLHLCCSPKLGYHSEMLAAPIETEIYFCRPNCGLLSQIFKYFALMVRKRNKIARLCFMPLLFSFPISWDLANYKKYKYFSKLIKTTIYGKEGAWGRKTISQPNFVQFSKLLVYFVPNTLLCNFAAHQG